MRLLGGVKMRGILGVFNTGVKIRTATEPPGRRGPEHAGIHVNGGAMRVLHMRHEADARGPEPRITVHARDTAGGHRLLRGLTESSVHLRDVHTDLFEDAPTTHHAHQSAARIRSVITGAAGFAYVKPPRCGIGHRPGGVAVFESFKGGNNLAAQLAKPCGGARFLCGEVFTHLSLFTVLPRSRPEPRRGRL